MEIIFNNNQNKVLVSSVLKDIIKFSALQTLNYLNFDDKVEIGIIFVDDILIKEMNLKYRNINEATDVLSFPMLEFDKPCLLTDTEFKTLPLILGDIFISLETALTQSKFFNHTMNGECAFLTIHSCLHLLGYDHEKNLESKIMFKLQDAIFNIVKNEKF